MVGLGGAFAPRADDGDAVYWNPAGLGFQTGTSFTFTHYQGFVDLKQEFLNAVHPLGKIGTFGLDALYSSVGNVRLYDDLGLDAGSVQNYDLALEASWGRSWKRFALGAGAKYFNSRLAEAVASGAALDLGALFRPDPARDILMGGSLQNLGTGLKYISVRDPLPLNLKVGISYKFALGSRHAALGSLEISRILYKYELTYLNFGLEYCLAGLLSLRAGYRMNRATDHFSLGAGVSLKPVRADYSFVPFDTLGGTHRISLGYDFLSPGKSGSPAPPSAGPGSAALPAEPSPTAQAPVSAAASPTMAALEATAVPTPTIVIPFSYAFRIPGDLLFQPGSPLLKDEANSILLQAATLIRTKYPGASVLIVGHTDNLPLGGGPGMATNYELSLARARGVAELLVRQGLDSARIQVQGAGDTKPAASNATEEGRAANRRVEVQVRGESSYTAETLAAEASTLSRTGDWSGALRLLVPAVRALPSNPLLLRLLGGALVQSGDLVRGLPFLKKSLELNPGDTELAQWLQNFEAKTPPISP